MTKSIHLARLYNSKEKTVKLNDSLDQLPWYCNQRRTSKLFLRGRQGGRETEREWASTHF